jgi:uncharacterized lipoprotein YbaY
MREQAHVRGEVSFSPPPGDLSQAKLFIRLEDTSYADAPAETIAETTLTNLGELLTPAGTIPFTISTSAIDPRQRYTISAHATIDGTDRLKPGDYINVEDYPVLTFGHPAQVTIEIRLF